MKRISGPALLVISLLAVSAPFSCGYAPAPGPAHAAVCLDPGMTPAGASTGAVCPLCGKVHGDSLPERLTETSHKALRSVLVPVIRCLPGFAGEADRVPLAPGGDVIPERRLYELPLMKETFEKALELVEDVLPGDITDAFPVQAFRDILPLN